MIEFKIPDINKSKSGIYKIKSPQSDTFYIGSASKLYGRYKQHNKELSKLNHGNYKLQNIYNLYEHVEFLIVEYCDKSILLDREQYYIDLYKNTGLLLNISLNVTKTNLGLTFSESHRNKIAAALKKPKNMDAAARKIRSDICKKYHKKMQANVIRDTSWRDIMEKNVWSKTRNRIWTVDQKKNLLGHKKGPRPDSVKKKMSLTKQQRFKNQKILEIENIGGETYLKNIILSCNSFHDFHTKLGIQSKFHSWTNICKEIMIKYNLKHFKYKNINYGKRY